MSSCNVYLRYIYAQISDVHICTGLVSYNDLDQHQGCQRRTQETAGKWFPASVKGHSSSYPGMTCILLKSTTVCALYSHTCSGQYPVLRVMPARETGDTRHPQMRGRLILRTLTWSFVLGAVLCLAVGIDQSAHPVVWVSIASFRKTSLEGAKSKWGGVHVSIAMGVRCCGPRIRSSPTRRRQRRAVSQCFFFIPVCAYNRVAREIVWKARCLHHPAKMFAASRLALLVATRKHTPLISWLLWTTKITGKSQRVRYLVEMNYFLVMVSRQTVRLMRRIGKNLRSVPRAHITPLFGGFKFVTAEIDEGTTL